MAGLGSALALAWGWRWFLPLSGPRSATLSVAIGIGWGAVATPLWLGLKLLASGGEGGGGGDESGGGAAWAGAAFFWRCLVTTTTVPLFEELLFRGLLLRGATQWSALRAAGNRQALRITLHERSANAHDPALWSAFALLFSAAVFASGHEFRELPAAFVYGLAQAALAIWRRDLLAPIAAHATTNALLALYAHHTGHWNLW